MSWLGRDTQNLTTGTLPWHRVLMSKAGDELAVIDGLTSPSDRISRKSLCYSCCRYCFLTTSTLSAISCVKSWQMEAGERVQLFRVLAAHF